MKILVLGICCCTSVMFGCHPGNGKAAALAITGSYAAEWKGDYSETKDTMQIIPLIKDDVVRFIITRKSFVQFTGLAASRLPEYKLVRWTGVYNEENRTIQIENNGRVLSFDGQSKEIIMGVVRYKKL